MPADWFTIRYFPITILTYRDNTHHRKDPVKITLTGQTMGSDYTVKYIKWADGTPQPAPDVLKAAIDARLIDVNAEMSTYIPTSNISQINQLRNTEAYPPLPRDFYPPPPY